MRAPALRSGRAAVRNGASCATPLADLCPVRNVSPLETLPKGVSVLERSLHFGPRTSVTTPLRSKGLGFGLSCSCTLKYASSRGRGNVLIPKGFPRSAGRVESRLLGFPCFPYSVISIACVGNAFHKVTITAKARFGNRNHLSEMATSRPSGKDPGCRRYRSPIKT